MFVSEAVSDCPLQSGTDEERSQTWIIPFTDSDLINSLALLIDTPYIQNYPTNKFNYQPSPCLHLLICIQTRHNFKYLSHSQPIFAPLLVLKLMPSLLPFD